MFTQLVESKPAGKRSKTGTVVSFVAHYGLILVVLYTSAEAADVDARPRDEKITFVQPKTVEPVKPKPPELIAAPLPTRAPSAFVAPIEVPSVLPDIDLTHAPTDPNTFRVKPQSAYYLVCPEVIADRPAVAAFRKWLLAQI